MTRVSFIVPAHNEEKTVPEAVRELRDFLRGLNDIEFEIIVVNDGSTDKTGEFLANIDGIKLVNHPYNKGYGASLKTGIKNSNYEWVFFFDSDGQACPKEIPKLLKFTNDYDMVVGNRLNKKASFFRKPGRAFLHWLANYLSDQKIPDLNCGFRAVKKSKIEEFWHLLPDSFSLTTTLTLAFQKSGLNIKFVPIEVNKRAGGKSSVNIKHALKTFLLILRTIVLFSPLRVFMPVVVFLWIILGLSLTYDIYHTHITNTTVMLFVSSLIIFLFGLLADQIAAIRREIKRGAD